MLRNVKVYGGRRHIGSFEQQQSLENVKIFAYFSIDTFKLFKILVSFDGRI